MPLGGRGKAAQIQLVTEPEEAGPLYTRVYRQLRRHILSGALAPGARVPSSRTLARDLGLSRNTVDTALDQLVAEGFLVRKVGSGSRVAASLQEAAPFVPRASRAARPAPEAPDGVAVRAGAVARRPRLPSRGALLARFGAAEIEADRDTGPCATETAGFPWRTWNRCLARQARRAGATLLRASPPAGLPELRNQLAEYASLARGLRCTADQVVVVSSAQQAIDLAARVLLDPGDEACMEDPGYPSARGALLAAGAALRLAAVDEEGIVVDDLPRSPARRLLYVTPSHQFPLGVTLGLARRLALLGWARKTGAYVLEDDYDSEFRYDGRPLAALHALDPARVLYVGTCNKVLFPGLRLAYLILPPGLVEPFVAARRLTDGPSPPLIQATLAEFMAGGHFAAYLRQARLRYAERRDRLLERARRAWGPGVRFGPSSTGLHLVAHLRPGTDDREVAREAQSGTLGVAALSRYYAGPGRKPGLLLSYGAATDADIAGAVARLAPHVRPTMKLSGKVSGRSSAPAARSRG